MYKKTKRSLYHSLIFLTILSFCAGLNLKDDKAKSNSSFNLDMKKEGLIEQNYYENIVTMEKESHNPYKSLPHCNLINCNKPFANCLDNFTCQCNKGYTNASYLTSNKNLFCRFKQRSQYVAFLLEFFMMCGIGHFYSVRAMMGFLKFLLACVCYITYDLLKKETDGETTFSKGGLKYLGYFVIGSFFMFHCYDLAMIGGNKYLDGNGIPLI